MRVPGGDVGAAAEPVPADDRDAHHRNDHAPDGDAADFAGDARTAEVGDGCQPQHADGGDTDPERAERSAKQLGAIADGGNGDGDVGDQQRNAVGVVRHKVA